MIQTGQNYGFNYVFAAKKHADDIKIHSGGISTSR